jgi:hypothetical protein
VSAAAAPSGTGSARRGAAAVLLLLGVVLAASFRIISGTEHHAYAVGAAAPAGVRVTQGTGHELATPGGVHTALARGIAQVPGSNGAAAHLALDCTWTTGGSAGQALPVVAEQVDTKAINTIGTFIAPVTGVLRVSCSGLGAMYVAGAGGGDPAGWLLLGAVLALTLGAGLGLSALRTALASQPAHAQPEPSR